ncbi:MAG TPA: hypothetical protein VKB26_10995 [Candidatus Acidoferrales bacterium]|nr:hypothetical protein [Candidatus Acidoferrales bacterium]
MRKEVEGDLAVARIYSYRHEAELARSALEAQGIEAMVEADDCGGQRPLMGATTGGVKLLVRRSDEGRAKHILQ